MDKETAIKLDHVHKRFSLTRVKGDTIKDSLLSRTKRRVEKEPFWALKDICLRVKKGECLGLIGKNGSGKTTLLRVIAGILDNDKGDLQVSGKVAPLTSLGSSFDPELTAKENVKTYCSMMGVSRDNLKRYLDKIIEFSGLKEYASVKTKNLSEGMKMRLAFATSIHLEGDILLIDEAFAVGDELFREKCKLRMESLLKQGKTIVYASHNLEQIKEVADNVLLLKNGSSQAYGDPQEIISKYKSLLQREQETKKLEAINNQVLIGDIELSSGIEGYKYLYKNKEGPSVISSAKGGSYCILSLSKVRPENKYQKEGVRSNYLTFREGEEFRFDLKGCQISEGFYKIDLTLPEPKKTLSGPYIKIESRKTEKEGERPPALFSESSFPSPEDSALCLLSKKYDSMDQKQLEKEIEYQLFNGQSTFALKKDLSPLSNKKSAIVINELKRGDLEKVKRDEFIKKFAGREMEDLEIKTSSKRVKDARLNKKRGNSLKINLSRPCSEGAKLVLDPGQGLEGLSPTQANQRKALICYPKGEEVVFDLKSVPLGIYDLKMFIGGEKELEAEKVAIKSSNQHSASNESKYIYYPDKGKLLFNSTQPLQDLKSGETFRLIEDIGNNISDLKEYAALKGKCLLQKGKILGFLDNEREIPLIIEEISFNPALNEEKTFKAGGKFSFDLRLSYLSLLCQKRTPRDLIDDMSPEFLLLFKRDGKKILHDTTPLEDWDEYLKKLEQEGTVRVRCNLPHLPLASGDYSLDIGLRTKNEVSWTQKREKICFTCKETANFSPETRQFTQRSLKKGFQLLNGSSSNFSDLKASDLSYQASKSLDSDKWKGKIKLENLSRKGPQKRSEWYRKGEKCGYGGVELKKVLTSLPLSHRRVKIAPSSSFRLGLHYKFTEKVRRPVINLEMMEGETTYRVFKRLSDLENERIQFKIAEIPVGSYWVSVGIFKLSKHFPPQAEYEDHPYDFVKDVLRLEVAKRDSQSAS